jgi:lipid-A-disaccharide synthase
VLCLYPFEPDFLSSSAVDACFVGHPAVHVIDSYSYSAAFYEMHDLNPQKPLLALFPGSRGFEVELCLPRMLEVARRMQTKDPRLQIAVSVASDRMAERIERILGSSEDSPRIARVPAAQRYELMHAARGALVVSGTVCLELALHALPAVVVYDVTYINYLIARYIARLDLDFYCNVNIIAQREVYPERIAIHFTSDSVMEALGLLWEEGAARERCIEGCKEIRHSLEQNDPSQQAAGAVEELLSP